MLGRRWGLLCFALDMGKGAIPVVVAGLLTDTIGRNPVDTPTASLWLWLLVAIAAFVGPARLIDNVVIGDEEDEARLLAATDTD